MAELRIRSWSVKLRFERQGTAPVEICFRRITAASMERALSKGIAKSRRRDGFNGHVSYGKDRMTAEVVCVGDIG